MAEHGSVSTVPQTARPGIQGVRFALPDRIPGLGANFKFDQSDLTVKRAANAMNKAREVAERQLDDARKIFRDESRSMGERHMAARQHVHAVATQATRELDAAIKDVAKHAGELEKTLTPPPPSDAVKQLKVNQICAALLHYPAAERRQKILESIQEGDDTISALFHMPTLVTGVSGVERAEAITNWKRAKFPAEFSRLEKLKTVKADLERNGALFNSFTTKLYSPYIVEEVQRMRVEADKALENA